MTLSITETLEDTRAYYSAEFKELVLEELYHNAYRTLLSVFMFEHFDEYIFSFNRINKRIKMMYIGKPLTTKN